MLQVVAARTAPAAANALSTHMRALHRATNDDPGAVRREAEAVRAAARSLVAPLATHDFTGGGNRPMAGPVIPLRHRPDCWRFSPSGPTTRRPVGTPTPPRIA